MDRRCKNCARFEPINPNITGLFRGLHDEIISIAYTCECGHGREIPIGRTTMKQMADARRAEIDGMRTSAVI